jgi:hypothetical protein
MHVALAKYVVQRIIINDEGSLQIQMGSTE